MKTTIILIAYVLLLIGTLTAFAVYMPKSTEVKQSGDFVGIDAVGFKHGEGSNSTIINH